VLFTGIAYQEKIVSILDPRTLSGNETT